MTPTPWAAIVAHVPCPKCGAAAGLECVVFSPRRSGSDGRSAAVLGRASQVPHSPRCDAYWKAQASSNPTAPKATP